MTDLAEIALRLRDQAAWIAIETTAIDDTVEELGLELADVPHAVTDLRGLSDEALVELDRTRDSRVGSTSQVFLGSAADLSRLARNAPHTWSLVGPDCWTLDPEADRLDVPARLEQLRTLTGWTNEAVLAAAIAGTLPNDPVWAEWLALLGRGDLLG